MATSVESLVNQALRRASYKIEIGSIYEGTTAARAALTLYGQTRDDLIRMKDWDFARQDATLVLLKTAPVGGYGLTPWTSAYPLGSWIYEYAYPAACLKIRSIRPTPIIIPVLDPQPVTFAIADDPSVSPAKVVLTNLANAQAVYSGQITDMTQWEATFTEAFIEALARRLGEALGANADAVKTQLQIEAASIAEADTVRG